ncbi:Uncharacterised protein [uncultured archaeon]|nr:Uncharacterised protein [uncultured archaeon]
MVREGEPDERLDRAAELLKDVIVAMNQGFGGLNNTLTSGFNRLGDGQDKMLEKQDRSIELLETIKVDTSDMKSTLSDVNSTLSRIEIDAKDTKFSLSSFIEEKFQKQELEIAEIKATLARMQATG